MADHRPVREALENRLMGQGIYLTAWEPTGEQGDQRGADAAEFPKEESEAGTVRIEYEVVTDHDAVTRDEVGTVVRAILSVAEERDGWEPITFEAAAASTAGTPRGSWRVEADWFRRLHEDLSEVEFSSLVLSTVTPPDDSEADAESTDASSVGGTPRGPDSDASTAASDEHTVPDEPDRDS